MSLPSGCRRFTFGYAFERSLENVSLPNGLVAASLPSGFSGAHWAMPAFSRPHWPGLQRKSRECEPAQWPSAAHFICPDLNQSLADVSLPSGLVYVSLPSGLQQFTLGDPFARVQWSSAVVLRMRACPVAFRSSVGRGFRQSLEHVNLPSGLRQLTLGQDCNQSLANASLPSGIQQLALGQDFNQSLENVSLPSGLVNVNLPSPQRKRECECE